MGKRTLQHMTIAVDSLAFCVGLFFFNWRFLNGKTLGPLCALTKKLAAAVAICILICINAFLTAIVRSLNAVLYDDVADDKRTTMFQFDGIKIKDELKRKQASK